MWSWFIFTLVYRFMLLFKYDDKNHPRNHIIYFCYCNNRKHYKRLKRLFPKSDILPFALSDESKTTTLNIPMTGNEEHPENGTLRPISESEGLKVKTQKTEVTTLDEWAEKKEPEKLDFIRVKKSGLSYIEEAVQNLVEKGILSKNEVCAISLKKIMTFFESELGNRIISADEQGTLRKEQAFNLLLEYNGEEVMVQGIIDCYFEEGDGRIVALKVNNEIFSLNRVIDVDAKVKAVFLDTREGAEIYRRTLCLVLAAASKSLYPTLRLLISHSLGYGYFYTFEGEKSEEINLVDIEKKMREMIACNLPIKTYWLSYEKALSDFSNSNQPHTHKLIVHTSKPRIMVNRLGDYQDLYFQPVLPTIGDVQFFELRKHHEGFLLRFPAPKDPYQVPPFEDVPHLFEIYKDDKYAKQPLHYNYQLEHIMPIKWEEHWSNVSYDDNPKHKCNDPILRQKRVEKITSLGNMTLLSAKLNIAISNDSFKNKIEGTSNKKGIKNYSSLSITTVDIIENVYSKGKEWNEAEITKREEKLADEIIEIWG